MSPKRANARRFNSNRPLSPDRSPASPSALLQEQVAKSSRHFATFQPQPLLETDLTKGKLELKGRHDRT